MDAAETFIKASIPFPELTKIFGAGDYEQLNQARNEIRQNLAAIECPIFGGEYGCVALAFTAEEYEERFMLHSKRRMIVVYPGDSGVRIESPPAVMV